MRDVSSTTRRHHETRDVLSSRLVAVVGLAVLVWASGSRTTALRLHAQTPPPAGKPGTEAVVEGDLEVLIEDSDRGSRTLYFLLSGTRRIRLRFLADPPELATGTRVRVQGRWDKDGMLVVTSIEAVRTPRSTRAWPLPTSRASPASNQPRERPVTICSMTRSLLDDVLL